MSSNKTPLIITIAVAVAAVAAAVILFVFFGNNKAPDNSNSSEPTELILFDERESAASELVSDNYEVIRLFVTEGLPLKTIYGDTVVTIDNAYMVDSDKYTEYAQIEALVKSVYTDEAAEQILNKTEVKSGDRTSIIRVYEDHNVQGEVFLGMSVLFTADEDYDTDCWSDCYIVTEPREDGICDLTVYVNGVTPENASDHPESVRKTTMVKTADGWRLGEFLK